MVNELSLNKNLISIKNKDKSDKLIKSLNLNRLPKAEFKKDEIDKVKDFLNKSDCKYYSIRSKIKSSGKFFYKVKPDDVINRIKNFDIFVLSESLIEADEKNLILQGSIQIFNDWTCIASLSDVKGQPNREAENNPKYKLFFNIIDDYEPNIRGLKQVIDYYVTHELFNFVLEFTLYDIPIGINKENIIVWEIRDY